jgi:hypothetical protein
MVKGGGGIRRAHADMVEALEEFMQLQVKLVESLGELVQPW